MKRLCKYFLISAIGLLVFLFTALHFSWFQKFCLYSILRTHFQDVQLIHFQGGSKKITADRMELKSEQGTIVFHSILLEWEPWQLLFKRTLHIQNLQLQAVIQIGECPTPPTQHTAGWSPTFTKKSQPFSFFQYLQPPIHVHLEQADLRIEKSRILCWTIDSLQIHAQHMVPGANGVIQYSISAKVPLSGTTLLLRTQGKLNLQTNLQGIWEKIAGKGNLHLQNGEQKILPITYTGYVAKVEPAPKEQMKIHLHSGQDNDFTLVGETLKTADHWVEFQSQGTFDQTLLQLFNIPHPATLSTSSKISSRLHRKTNQWQNNIQLSIGAKDFDPKISSLPMVQLKAHFDTECDAHQIQLNQYDLQLKEWNGSRLFFSMHSLQPLRYHFKEGLQGFSKENAQLFTLTFYEIPFEIFNPYLQAYGYRIQGNSNSGHIAVHWESQPQRFNLQTLQPITFHIRQLDRNGTPILSNVQGKCHGQATLQNQFSHLQYKGSFTLNNPQQMPFVQWTTQGNYHASDPFQFSSAGTLDFRQDWAKDCLSLQPFSLELHPELQGHATYEMAQKRDKNLKEWNLKNLHINLSSSVTEQSWLSVQSHAPITVQNNTVSCSSTEPFLTIRAQQLPLDILRYADLDLRGKLSMEAKFSAYEKGLVGIIKPTTLLSSVTASFQQKPFVDFERITLEETRGTYSPQKGWSLTLNGLQAFSSSATAPFFQTQFQCHGKEKQIQASKGRCKAQLDALSLQPFALSYPGFAGNLTSNWDWSEKQKSIRSHLYATCTDLPFTTDLQANYQQSPENHHQLQGHMEVQHAACKSDVTFENTLNPNNQLTGKWTSKQLFLQDMVAFGVGIGKIAQKFSQKPSASAPAHTPSTPSSAQPHPFQGTCDFHCQSIVDLAAQSIEGRVSFDPKKISFQLPKGTICQGNLQAKATFDPLTTESHVDLSLQNVDVKTAWGLLKHFGSSLESYGKLQGTASTSLQIAGNFAELQTLHGHLSLQAKDGAFRPKGTIFEKGQAVAGVSNLVGIATGQTIPASASVGFLSSYLQNIPFSSLSMEVQRLPQKPVAFQAHAINPDLSITLNGSLETRPFCSWNQQLFVTHVQFRAPQQSPFTQYFHFDPKKTDAKGYGEGPQCTIDGTLKKPNYLALFQLLTQTQEPANDPSAHPVTNLLQHSPIQKILDLL